jgi:hypothetical protein
MCSSPESTDFRRSCCPIPALIYNNDIPVVPSRLHFISRTTQLAGSVPGSGLLDQLLELRLGHALQQPIGHTQQRTSMCETYLVRFEIHHLVRPGLLFVRLPLAQRRPQLRQGLPLRVRPVQVRVVQQNPPARTRTVRMCRCRRTCQRAFRDGHSTSCGRQ